MGGHAQPLLSTSAGGRNLGRSLLGPGPRAVAGKHASPTRAVGCGHGHPRGWGTAVRELQEDQGFRLPSDLLWGDPRAPRSSLIRRRESSKRLQVTSRSLALASSVPRSLNSVRLHLYSLLAFQKSGAIYRREIWLFLEKPHPDSQGPARPRSRGSTFETTDAAGCPGPRRSQLPSRHAASLSAAQDPTALTVFSVAGRRGRGEAKAQPPPQSGRILGFRVQLRPSAGSAVCHPWWPRSQAAGPERKVPPPACPSLCEWSPGARVTSWPSWTPPLSKVPVTLLFRPVWKTYEAQAPALPWPTRRRRRDFCHFLVILFKLVT